MFLFICVLGLFVMNIGLAFVVLKLLCERFGVRQWDLPDGAVSSLLYGGIKNDIKFVFYFILAWPYTYTRAYRSMRKRYYAP